METSSKEFKGRQEHQRDYLKFGLHPIPHPIPTISSHIIVPSFREMNTISNARFLDCLGRPAYRKKTNAPSATPNSLQAPSLTPNH